MLLANVRKDLRNPKIHIYFGLYVFPNPFVTLSAQGSLDADEGVQSCSMGAEA